MINLRVAYSTWQEANRAIATAWNYFMMHSLTASDRWSRGVDTDDDIIVDDIGKGIVLKSSDGHYWRVQVTSGGSLTTTDLGTTKP